MRAGFVLANGMGIMPVTLQTAEGIETREGRVFDLLNRKASDFQTVVEFRETLTLHAVFSGTGRAFIRRRVDGEPVELIPLHPTWTPGGWAVAPDGEYRLAVSIPEMGYQGDFTRADIIEISNPRWDILFGANVTHTCSRVLGLSTRLEARQAKLADTNAPYGVITTPTGTSEGSISKLTQAGVKHFGQRCTAIIALHAPFHESILYSPDQPT